MKKYFALLFFISQFCFSQRGTIKVEKHDDADTSLPTLDTTKNTKNHFWQEMPNQITFGYLFIDLSDLNAGIFTNGNSFPGKIMCYGIEKDDEYILSRAPGQKPGSGLCYIRIDPQKISDSDSSSWTLSGFRFHFLNFGIDVLQRSRLIDLIFYGGLEYGRLRLEHKIGGTKDYAYKDPFLAVNLMSDLRINILPRTRRVAIGARVGYDYDLGNPRWIGVSGGGPHLPGTKMRGYYYAALIAVYFD